MSLVRPTKNPLPIEQWQRIVVKVGSSIIAPQGDGCELTYVTPISEYINKMRELGKEVILVSSGSVAAGRSQIKTAQEATIVERQAMAAIGQSQMMGIWASTVLATCAQILVCADDFNQRQRYINFKNTIRTLLKNDVLPVINENDSINFDDFTVGDNDNLAAHVALVLDADALIIASDVAGLYDGNPASNADATLFPVIEQLTDYHFDLAGGSSSSLGTGGMTTKLQAATRATRNGISTLIVNGKDAVTFDLLADGDCPGTHFLPQEEQGSARTRWLRDTLQSRGVITIDQGAATALIEMKKSLLAVGIVDVSGDFDGGDAVDIECNGELIGKGITPYNHRDLSRIKGLSSQEIPEALGYEVDQAAIHRDDMVVF